jgi:arsenite-transporting ATPase
VDLTTTDPAGQLPAGLAETPNLRVSSLDPEAETQAYKAEIMSTAGAMLDERGRALLEEDLRSPCTEEIAVFRAFAARVSEAEGRIVVIDTAPTGHTLLLLDAAQSYHREVLRHPGGAPEEVLGLLPRLRDPDFTRVLLVTLPEATPGLLFRQASAGQLGIREGGPERVFLVESFREGKKGVANRGDGPPLGHVGERGSAGDVAAGVDTLRGRP